MFRTPANELAIFDKELTSKDIAEIAQKLNNYSCIQLRNCELTDDKLTPLIEALKKNRTLTKINLSNNYLKNIEPLCSALAHHETLQTLNLRYNCLDESIVTPLTNLLSNNTALENIDFSCNKFNFNREHDAALLKHLQDNHSLLELTGIESDPIKKLLARNKTQKQKAPDLDNAERGVWIKHYPLLLVLTQVQRFPEAHGLPAELILLIAESITQLNNKKTAKLLNKARLFSVPRDNHLETKDTYHPTQKW